MTIDPTAPRFDPSIGRSLHALMSTHGHVLLQHAGHLQQALAEQHPQARREIAIVMQALQAGVPQALLTVPGQELPLAGATRLAHQLSDHTGLAAEAAQWAVHAWAQGLGSAPLPLQAPVMSMGMLTPAVPMPARQAMQAMPSMAALAPAGAGGGSMAIAGSGVAGGMGPGMVLGSSGDGRSLSTMASGRGGASSSGSRKAPVALLAGLGALLVAGGVGAWYLFGHATVQIQDVQARGALVANGKPQPVTLNYQAKNAPPQRVEVRFVRGEGQWNPSQWTIDVPAAGAGSGTASGAGSVSAGTLAYRSAIPVKATFEYTLVSRDGLRSAPLERSFEFLPPVAITQARGPARLTLNQPYTVALAYKRGGGDIVQVVRKVVETDTPWAEPEKVLPVQLNADSGTYEVPFEAPGKPMRSTVEFTLIDTLGVSSEPVRVALNAAAQPLAPMTSGPATVLNVAQVAASGAPVGTGAVVGGVAGAAIGNRFGRGGGRTAMTVLGAVGGAVAGHQIEQNVRGPAQWDTMVRFVDGNTRTLRHDLPPRWAAGDRVTVTGAGAILR